MLLDDHQLKKEAAEVIAGVSGLGEDAALDSQLDAGQDTVSRQAGQLDELRERELVAFLMPAKGFAADRHDHLQLAPLHIGHDIKNVVGHLGIIRCWDPHWFCWHDLCFLRSAR